MPKEEEANAEIVKRLNVLIALSIRKELKEDKSLTMRDVIAQLSSLGLKYTEIAEIFGKSPSYVSSEISQIKKGGKNVQRR